MEFNFAKKCSTVVFFVSEKPPVSIDFLSQAVFGYKNTTVLHSCTLTISVFAEEEHEGAGDEDGGEEGEGDAAKSDAEGADAGVEGGDGGVGEREGEEDAFGGEGGGAREEDAGLGEHGDGAQGGEGEDAVAVKPRLEAGMGVEAMWHRHSCLCFRYVVTDRNVCVTLPEGCLNASGDEEADGGAEGHADKRGGGAPPEAEEGSTGGRCPPYNPLNGKR